MSDLDTTRKVIAVSIGESPDLAELGFGTEHLDTLAVRLARWLLRHDFNISYGGIFKAKGLLPTLFDVVRAEDTDLQNLAANSKISPKREPRLISYQPWPHYRSVTPEVVAQTLGLVRYVKVHPSEGENFGPQTEASTFLDPPDPGIPTGAAQKALALTRMRVQMMDETEALDGDVVHPATARIVLGGKTRGWSGFLPGIAEEALRTYQKQKPLFILGAFGGCAREIAGYLLGDDDELPSSLTFSANADHLARVKSGLTSLNKVPSIVEDNFEELGAFLKSLRSSKLHGLNSLSYEENRTLMLSDNLIDILRLLQTALVPD